VALSDAEKIRIRRFIGWSDRFNNTDEALVRAFAAIDTLPDTVDEIRLLIARCDDIETRVFGGGDVKSAIDRLKASQVGAITLNEAEVQQLLDLGLMSAAQIARLLGVEVRGGNPWSTSIPTERAWYGGPMGGGGLIPFS
jgi:hypothetical protein